MTDRDGQRRTETDRDGQRRTDTGRDGQRRTEMAYPDIDRDRGSLVETERQTEADKQAKSAIAAIAAIAGVKGKKKKPLLPACASIWKPGGQ